MINTYSTHERTPSGLNTQNFREAGFPEQFCTVLEHGLPLLLGANPPNRAIPNYASATSPANHEFMRTTLNKWETMGIIRYVEHQPHIVNPLSVVVNENKQRLVLDARSSGLNDNIISPKFILPDIGEIVQTLRSHDFMVKLDLANGFLQLPIQKNEQKFLGFRSPIDGRYGVLQRLPFGLRSAPFLFSSFTNALRQAMEQILQLKTHVYIDDWFIANHTLADVTTNLETFSGFLAFLGVEIKHEKTEGPARSITYLGIVLDTAVHEIRLAENKRVKYLQGIIDLMQSETPTMAMVAKTAGRLVHIAFVHREGAAYVQPFWEVLYKERKTWTRTLLEQEELTLDAELKECLIWWKDALLVPNIRRKIWVSPTGQLFLWTQQAIQSMSTQALTICTDASNDGWGATTGLLTVAGKWSNRQKRTSINWRELKAVNLSINSWEFIRETPILILSDSATVIAAIRKRSSHAAALCNLIKELSDIEAERNIEVIAVHIPGVLNDLPDRLSRNMNWQTATTLSFDRESAHPCIRNVEQLCGMAWKQTKFDACAFPRNKELMVKPQTLLVAVTTPDIPYLKQKWSQLENHNEKVFILLPCIPTSELPLLNTVTIKSSPVITCIDAPHTEWILLEVVRNGGSFARTVTSS